MRRPGASLCLHGRPGWRRRAGAARRPQRNDPYCAGTARRLRAGAACRAWQRALQGLPYHSLDLRHPSNGAPAREVKQQWIVRTQPAATNFTVCNFSEQCTLALHSLDRQVRCRRASL